MPNKLNQLALDTNKPSKRLLITCVLICIVATMIVAGIIGPGSLWDFNHYHYYNGYAFLNHRMLWDYRPAGEHSYLNPLLDAANYSLIANLPQLGAAMIIAAWQGLAFGFTFLIGAQIFPQLNLKRWPMWCLIFIFLGLYSPKVMRQLGASGLNNDVSSAVFILISIYFWMKNSDKWKSVTSNSALIIAGASMGVAVGLKLTNFSYALAMGLSSLILQFNRDKYFRYLAILASSMLVGFLLTNGWWMYILWKNFHNPVYPFYNNIFHAPGWPFNDPGIDTRYRLQHWWEILTFPLIIILKYYRIATAHISTYMYIVSYLCLFLLCAKVIWNELSPSKYNIFYEDSDTKFKLKQLILFYIIGITTSLTMFFIYRYLCPLNILTPLIILIILSMTISKNYITPLLFAVAIIILISTYPQMPINPNWKSSITKLRKNKITDSKNLPKKALVIMARANQSTYLIPSMPKKWRFINLSKNVEPTPYFEPHKTNPATNHPPSKYIVEKYFKWAIKNKAAYYLMTSYKFHTKNQPPAASEYVNESITQRKKILEDYNLKISGKCDFINYKPKITAETFNGVFLQYVYILLCPLSKTENKL